MPQQIDITKDKENPDYFTPVTKNPDYFTPAKPDEAAPDEGTNYLSKAWSAFSSPPKFITDAARSISDYITTPQKPSEGGGMVQIGKEKYITPEENDIRLAQNRGFLGGGTEAAANTLTPLNATLAAVGAGEGAAVKAIAGGASEYIPTLLNIQRIRQALSGGIGLHGLSNLFGANSTLTDRLMAIPELAGSAVGMFGGKFVRQPPKDMPTALPPSGFTGGQPNKTVVEGPIVGGNKGLALNKPYFRDTEAPYSVQKPQGGTLTPSDVGSRIMVPPHIAAQYGLQPGIQKDIQLPNPNHEPQEMRVPIKGQSRDNIAMGGASERVLDVVGTSLYSRSRPQIIVKELLQNSFDEHRIAGQTKPIVVLIEHYTKIPGTKEEGNSITVKDSGRGMTPDQLYTKFTDLGETGKGDEESASGGFGFAKAAPMLGGQYFKAESTVMENGRMVKYTFEGNKADLKNQTKGVKLDAHVYPPNTDVTEGLKVTTWFNKTEDLYGMDRTVEGYTSNSPSITSPVIFAQSYGHLPSKIDQFLNDPTDTSNPVAKDAKTFIKQPEQPLQGTIETPGADINIHYEDNPKTTTSEYNLHFLNKGMYQSTSRYGYPKALDKVPKNIRANIIAKVEEGHEDYPFSANREQLNYKTANAIDTWIKKNVISGALEKNAKKLEGLYQNMDTLSNLGTNRPVKFFDPGDRLTTDERTEIEGNPVFQNLSKIFDTTLNDVANVVDLGNHNSKLGDKLEGSGIFFSEPGLYGIHIPNPKNPANKSTILINPFTAMLDTPPDEAAFTMVITALHEAAHINPEESQGFSHKDVAELQDPRIGKYLQAYLKEMDEQGGTNAGHGMEFVKSLAEVFTQYGPERTFETHDQIFKTITDQSGGYNAEVQKLLQLYQESRGRDATSEDFLSTTGTFSKSPTRGKKSGGGDSQSNAGRIIDKLTNALKEARVSRTEQEALYSEERGKRINKAERYVKTNAAGEIRNPGVLGLHKQLNALKGPLPKADYEGAPISPEEADTLIDNITNSNRLLPFEKIRAKVGLLKLVSGAEIGGPPQHEELNLLHQVFGKAIEPIIEMHGGFGAVGGTTWKVLKEVAGLQKAMMASIDMSALLRQGSGLIHRKEWWQAVGPMVKMFGNKEFFDASMESIKDDPMYLLSKEGGLKLTAVGSNPNVHEEQFNSKFADKIPGIAASERAYVGFLNKVRFDVFKALIQEAKDAGLHPKDTMHEISNYINVVTGRGQLPGKLDRVATDLNAVFFSPRLIASRIQMMNPATYVKASPFVRKEFIKSAIAIASMGLITSGLMKMMGAKLATKLSDSKGDPLIPGLGHGLPYMPIDADFGKSRFGNTRMENYGGFLPYVTYFGRMLSGERESSTTGKMYILGKGFAAPNRLTITEDFMGNKLSPMASLVYKVLKQKDPTGKPYQFSPTVAQSLIDLSKGNLMTAVKNAKSGETADTFIPMFLGDFISIMKDDPNHAPLLIGSFFGAGTQTYAKNPPKPNSAFRLRMQ